MLLTATVAQAQYAREPVPAEDGTVVVTLDEALVIALSENIAVKVADKEIERVGYARKGTYASLLPQVNGSGAYQRTLKKQVMYMDFDMSAMMGGGASSGASGSSGGASGSASGTGSGTGSGTAAETGGPSSGGGIEVGRWNTWSAGISAAMPLVNVQLWESLRVSGQQVELAVEQARESRLNTVTQVKQAFYAVLLAKEAFAVYRDVYENAVDNFAQTEKRYNVQKASELEYTRAKATVANAIPNVYNAESSVILALWQLKAVMGVDLDMDLDVAGSLDEFAAGMQAVDADYSLEGNTSLRQLAIQAEQLAAAVRMQRYAYLPTLAASFSYSYNAMTNDFKFSEYKWTPYSYVGVSLSIPIFSGGQRYHAVKQARMQAAELDLQRVSAERQLRIGIRQSLQGMETAMKSYAAAMDAVSTAEKAYGIAAKSYQVGRSTITELNDAQLALTQARLGASQAVYNYIVAQSQLEQTLGHDFLDEAGNVDLNNR